MSQSAEEATDTSSNNELPPQSQQFGADLDESEATLTEVDELLADNHAPMTPVRRNTDISNASDTSSILLGVPSPFTILTMAASEDTDDTNSTEGEPESGCPKWSEVLNSPSNGAIYSPSLEWNKPGHFHGAGLRLATQRAKKLSQTGRRCASLLSDVAGMQSAFAQDILKACQAQVPTSSGKNTEKMRSVQRSLVSFASQIQGLVVGIRGSVARPLNSSMATMGETVPNIFNRYTETRVKCTASRTAALRARARYVKAVQDAEAVIGEMHKVKEAWDGDNNSMQEGCEAMVQSVDLESSTRTLDSLEKSIQAFGKKYSVSPERLIVLLNDIRLLEAKYRALVGDENQAVSLAQTMERMALEALHKLEEERLQFVVESISRALQAEKGALDKMVLSTSVDSAAPSIPDMKSVEDKKPKDFFKNFLKTPSGPEDDEMGIMEAEALGLSQDVGILRDRAKTSLAAKHEQLQAVKSLTMLLEAISATANNLSSNLQTRLRQEGYGESREERAVASLSAILEKTEGPRLLSYWDGVVMTIDDCSESARHLSFTLRNTRQTHLDEFLIRAEKEIRASSATNDQRWKELCQAARQESKARLRYEQTISQFEKARERVQSVDDDLAVDGTRRRRGSRRGSATQMAPGVSKALGNVFSILPDGGEQAMQILTPSARLAVAKQGLEDADLREAKDRELLEAAEAARAEATSSFTTTAQLLVVDTEKDTEACWQNVNSALENVVAALVQFRSDRYNAAVRSSSAAPPPRAMAADMTDWTVRARRHIKKKAASIENEEKIIDGFKLAVDVAESKSVYSLLHIVVGDGEDFVSSNADDPTPRASNQTTNRRSSFEKKSEAYMKDQVTESLSASTKQLVPIVDMINMENYQQTSSPPTPERVVSRESSQGSPETDIFVAHFWADHGNGAPPPSIIQTFACAYWPKEDEGYLSPLLHGRLFVTAKTMYFVGWGEKKIVLDLRDTISVEKASNLLGAIDNSLRVTYELDAGESSYFFGSFASRDDAFMLLRQLVTIEQSLRELEEEKTASTSVAVLPEVANDRIINKMDILVSKKLKNVSVRKFYEVIWSEGNHTEAVPFYGPWCEEMGSRKVHVGDWEFAEDGSPGFRNDWCDETYQQRRVVSFEFTRTTHLYVGPPTAAVTQTQYCTVDGDDKCVLEMTVEMEGIPYADCFAVEVRWVARRVGAYDIQVQVGAFVDFRKSTMFAKQIRSGTVSETKPVHEKLFNAAKKACAVAALGKDSAEKELSEEEADDDDVHEVSSVEYKGAAGDLREKVLDLVPFDVSPHTKFLIVGFACFTILRMFSHAFRRRRSRQTAPVGVEELSASIDDLQTEIREIHKTLQAILKAMELQRD